MVGNILVCLHRIGNILIIFVRGSLHPNMFAEGGDHFNILKVFKVNMSMNICTGLKTS